MKQLLLILFFCVIQSQFHMGNPASILDFCESTSSSCEEEHPKYLGCYQDHRYRAFVHCRNDTYNNTIDSCIDYCLSKKFQYAATQLS